MILDFEGESDSECDPGFESGSAIEGDPVSEDGAYKGGTSEGRAYKRGPASEGFYRPYRVRQKPRRLADFKLLQDTEIDSDGEFI